MLRSNFRVVFALAVVLSLVLGVFGTGVAAAATPTGSGSQYSPVASTPPGTGYCYPSGYNRNGWRCGWRLAQAPYNLGDYYGYYYGYYNMGYYPYYGNGGTGGYPPQNGDYGGRPRFMPYWYNYYYPYQNNCNYWYNGVCY